MKYIIECVIEIIGAILMIISIPLLISMFINIFKELKYDKRYKVICMSKSKHGNNFPFYSERTDFLTRKEARLFIKSEKKSDKRYFNKHNMYFKYKIVKIK